MTTDNPVRPVSETVSAADMDQVLAQILTDNQPSMDRQVSRAATNLKRASNVIEQVEIRKVHNHTGLTPAAFRVLLMTWAFGPVEAKHLSRISGVSRQAVSGVLANLERDGLVSRERAVKSDRRLVPTQVTDAGRELIEANIAHHNAVQREFFSPLSTEELETLTDLLRRLVVNAHEELHG